MALEEETLMTSDPAHIFPLLIEQEDSLACRGLCQLLRENENMNDTFVKLQTYSSHALQLQQQQHQQQQHCCLSHSPNSLRSVSTHHHNETNCRSTSYDEPQKNSLGHSSMSSHISPVCRSSTPLEQQHSETTDDLGVLCPKSDTGTPDATLRHRDTHNTDDRQTHVANVTSRSTHVTPMSRSLTRWTGLIALVSCLFCLTGSGHAMPSNRRDTRYESREKDAVKYLAQFGYLSGPNQETQNLMNRADLRRAIKTLQRAGGIGETGRVDERTLELMQRKRCGNMDDFMRQEDKGYHGDGISHSRRKRYTVATSKWPRTNLTFHFLNYTKHMRDGETRQIIKKALQVWSNATSLSFTETHDNQADILIQFAKRYHSDGYPFDGPGMVLAHAFFPGGGKGGDTHFDDDEAWSLNSSGGIDLFMVAAHEFGHALGLAHSGDPSALMYPWYMGLEGHFKLPEDDYRGITYLYGSVDRKFPDRETGVNLKPGGRNPIGPTIRPPTIDETDDGPPDLCNSRIDALTRFRSELFIFVGKWCFRYFTNKQIQKPMEIHTFWYGLPANVSRIDAVFQRKDKRLVFFSGDRFWVFNSNYLESGFPKEGRSVTEFNIPADVKKIDAAFVWGYNKGTYLVSGDMYWKMNENNTFVEYDYPRPMGTWKGVPTPLDSAFQDHSGKTLFFQELDYWVFYDIKMRVKRGYPRRIKHYFPQCAEHISEQRQLEIEEVETQQLDESDAFRQNAVEESQSQAHSNDQQGNGCARCLIGSTVLMIVFFTCFVYQF